MQRRALAPLARPELRELVHARDHLAAEVAGHEVAARLGGALAQRLAHDGVLDPLPQDRGAEELRHALVTLGVRVRAAGDALLRLPAPGGSVATPLAAVLIVPTSLYAAWEYFGDRQRLAWDHPVSWVRGWGLGNVFHVFPTMQTERQELTIEGSNDGENWTTVWANPDEITDSPRVSA